MRRRDKSKNIAKANLLAEQRYLESKGVVNESGMAHAAGFADGGSGFEEGATMMQDNVDVLKEDDECPCGGDGSGSYETNVNGHDVEATCPCEVEKQYNDKKPKRKKVDEAGIKKNSKRIKITEAQRCLLESKGLLTEGTESTNLEKDLKLNLTDPSSDLFTFDFNGKRTTLRVTRVNKISFDNANFLRVDVQLEPNHIIGDTQTIVVGNNAKDVFLPSEGNTGELELVSNSKTYLFTVKQGMLKQKSQQQDDTINELEATNKETGEAVTKHVNDYMAGNIDREEFEKLTGLKKESINVDVLKEDSDTYFETLSATLDHVREMAKEMGYELDEDDVNFQFGTGGISYGQTKSATIPLLKDGEPIMGKSGKPLNRAIRVSIYRMDSGRYELTAYKTF